MKCPKCSSPMRITCSGQRRYWECTKWSRFEDGIPKVCNKTVQIDEEQELGIKEIAEDLAREAFGSSDTRAKEQAKYRRIAGGVNNTLSNKYISSIERSTLIAASRILERLATAAERAKKEKKRIENEEEQRRRNRESQASRLLFERYANGSLNTRETAITMEAFCRLNNNPSRLEKRDIEDAITYCHRYNKKVVEVITARINMGLKEELLRMASDIAWRDPEVDELVGVVCDNFEAMIGKVEMEKKAVLDRLDEVIAIYQSEQVIPLNPRKAIDNYSR